MHVTANAETGILKIAGKLFVPLGIAENGGFISGHGFSRAVKPYTTPETCIRAPLQPCHQWRNGDFDCNGDISTGEEVRRAFAFGNCPTALRQRKAMEKCPEYARLRTEVENVLGNLAQVTTLLLELFRSDNSEKYKHLDKELELTVGEKERAVGALRQHIREHKCRPTERF